MDTSDTVQVKITANSADEAVNLIKERFGDQATVIKVQKSESGGLKRLMSKPRLEVFVAVKKSALNKGKPAVKKAEMPNAEPASPKASVESSETLPTNSVDSGKKLEAPKNPISKLYSKSSAAPSNYFESLEDEIPSEINQQAEEAPLGTAANPVRRGTVDAVSRGISMLKSVGFDETLIERIRYDIDFKKVGEKSQTMDLYSLICDWLRQNFPDTKDFKRGKRRAFIGTSSVGKTSALCKSLASDIFLHGLEPNILKIDTDIPNTSDALEAFCDIMGRPLARSIDEVESSSDEQPLYIDLPGFNLTEMDRVQEYKRMLDEMEVDERVLVVNASYDSDMIAATFNIGVTLGAQFAVFTHLDETIKIGKLWKYALNGRIKPLFLSHGTNPAGDYTFDSFSYLLGRSFPHGRSIMSSTRRESAANAVDLEKGELVS
ncbi:hypothetical protein MLD52_04750 [Puniceicoccaceae bacterium K14]|nr:hypothetical protein [Puniceicoccaceae bacterium K14]